MEPSLDRAMVQSKSAGRTMTFDSNGQEMAGENAQRVALIVTPHKSNALSLGLSAQEALDAGMTLPAGGPPFILSLALHGNLVQRAWYARCAAGATVFYVIEVVSHAQ